MESISVVVRKFPEHNEEFMQAWRHDPQLKQLQGADAVAVAPLAEGLQLVRAQQSAHHTLLLLQVGRQVLSALAHRQIQALRCTEGQNHSH